MRLKKLLFQVCLWSSSQQTIAQIKNWQHLDLSKDSVFGVSAQKAFDEILRDKKSNQVIVAVIDSGTEYRSCRFVFGSFGPIPKMALMAGTI